MISNTNTNKSNSTSATDETETTFQVKDCNDQNIGTPVKVKQTAVLNKVTAKICNTEDIYNPINARIDNLSNGLGSKEDAVATSDTGSFSLISFFKRAIQNWTTLLSRIPELSGGKIPVTLGSDNIPISGTITPAMISGGNLAVTTNLIGTTFNTFSSQVCKQLNISNQTGVTIEVRQGGAGVGFQIPTGAFYTFFGITNANQLEIRRVDLSNTQVTVTARWEV